MTSLKVNSLWWNLTVRVWLKLGCEHPKVPCTYMIFVCVTKWVVLYEQLWTNDYHHDMALKAIESGLGQRFYCVFEFNCQNLAGWFFVPGPPLKISGVNLFLHEQNGRHFEDDIFRCIFVNKKFCMLIKISLKFVPEIGWPDSGSPPIRLSDSWKRVQLSITQHWLRLWRRI